MLTQKGNNDKGKILLPRVIGKLNFKLEQSPKGNLSRTDGTWSAGGWCRPTTDDEGRGYRRPRRRERGRPPYWLRDNGFGGGTPNGWYRRRNRGGGCPRRRGGRNCANGGLFKPITSDQNEFPRGFGDGSRLYLVPINRPTPGIIPPCPGGDPNALGTSQSIPTQRPSIRLDWCLSMRHAPSDQKSQRDDRQQDDYFRLHFPTSLRIKKFFGRQPARNRFTLEPILHYFL